MTTISIYCLQTKNTSLMSNLQLYKSGMQFNMKSFAFLMLLLVPFFVSTTQGRPARNKSMKIGIDTTTGSQVDVMIRSNDRVLVDDGYRRYFTTKKTFLPTTPGHSPGAGH